jgi:hypothetical protein
LEFVRKRKIILLVLRVHVFNKCVSAEIETKISRIGMDLRARHRRLWGVPGWNVFFTDDGARVFLTRVAGNVEVVLESFDILFVVGRI